MLLLWWEEMQQIRKVHGLQWLTNDKSMRQRKNAQYNYWANSLGVAGQAKSDTFWLAGLGVSG
jgi:hypothetical protein